MKISQIYALLSLTLFILLWFHVSNVNGIVSKNKKPKKTRYPNGTRVHYPTLSEVIKRNKKQELLNKAKSENDTKSESKPDSTLDSDSDVESLNLDWLRELDTTGILKRIIKRKIHIPKDSSLSLSSQVSRPNIFPNIFNQGEGFIVDAVIDWNIWLNLHKLSLAANGELVEDHDGDKKDKSDLEFGPEGSSNSSSTNGDSGSTSEGKSLSGGYGFIGVERCLIYEHIEKGMSVYLDISRNQSHDCMLRAVCEAQQVAEYYPVAPFSIFFEVVHLILKPSLSQSRTEPCYAEYLAAEKAAHEAPKHCTELVSKCPLNMAGLFVRNFFPEIL